MFARVFVALSLVLGFVSAQLPKFPDNIVAFPDNDIVEVLGFNGANPETNLIGRTVQVQVVRTTNGVSTVIGEAFPTISGGDLAFTINHPFGYCWGVGSKYQVTPDLRAGDEVLLFADGKQVASSIVQGLTMTEKHLRNNVLTITGKGVAALADPTFIECRIVQPALVNTNVGRRDVRAIPLINFPNAQGYRSSITTNGDSFTCQWTFFDAAGLPNPHTAASAFTGLFLISSWQATDPAGNERGLTISEFGAMGGPMDGSCPLPAKKVKPQMSSGIAYDGKKLLWNAGSDIPGAVNKLNQYTAEVLRPTATAGLKTIVGYTVPSSSLSAAVVAPDVTVQALDEIHVRAWSENAADKVDVLSAAARNTISTITNVAAPTAPTFSAAANAIVSSVKLTSAQGLQLAYTLTTGTTGVAPVLGGNAIIYSADTPIKIVGTQTIVAVAFDHAGHVSATSTATFTNPVPAQLAAIRATAIGAGVIRVAWTPASGPVTGFRVYLVDGAVKTLIGTAAATASFFDVKESALVKNGGSYTFVVAAINQFNAVVYESPVSDVSVPAPFIKGPDGLIYNIQYRPGTELKIDGTGTLANAVISVYNAVTNELIGSAGLLNGALKLRVRPVSATITAITIKSNFGFAAVNVPIA